MLASVLNLNALCQFFLVCYTKHLFLPPREVPKYACVKHHSIFTFCFQTFAMRNQHFISDFCFRCAMQILSDNTILVANQSTDWVQMDPHILHWSYRDFREFPAELIEHSDTVEEIYLKENFIPTLPQWLFDFIHLKFIQLSGNLLQTIPNEIGCLVSLEHLDLSKNHITELPRHISQLNKLQILNVSGNEIHTLNAGKSTIEWIHQSSYYNCSHTDLGMMKSLETLNISKNRLREIPLELARSTSIVELFLNDNDIIEIPNKVMSMQSLKVLEAERKSLPVCQTELIMMQLI